MNINVNSALQLLCNSFRDAYGNSILNYGEATESLLDSQAGNYITIDGSRFCAVNDAYAIVLFFVRQSATPSDQQGGGMKNSLFRTTTYRMAVNSRKAEDEFALTHIINNTQGIAYVGTNFEGRVVANDMFGLEERNFQTAFFTIDFTAIEKITCQPC